MRLAHASHSPKCPARIVVALGGGGPIQRWSSRGWVSYGFEVGALNATVHKEQVLERVVSVYELPQPLRVGIARYCT